MTNQNEFSSSGALLYTAKDAPMHLLEEGERRAWAIGMNTRPAKVQDAEVVAWEFELATNEGVNGEYCDFQKRISKSKPNVPEGAVRNLRPLVYCAKAQGVPEEWREALQEFVVRCDIGEVRSTYTYNKFKRLLSTIPPSDHC